MVLPIPDLTGVIAAIDRNTNMMQNIVDELVRMNEDRKTDVDAQVNDIRQALELQYRSQITRLESLIPDDPSFINRPVRGNASGGLGGAPGVTSPE